MTGTGHVGQATHRSAAPTSPAARDLYSGRPPTPTSLLAGAVDRYPNRPLLIDPVLARRVSYTEFAQLVGAAAASLLRLGAAPGDRVALAARNGLEAAVGIWACAHAGLIYLGLPPDGPAARTEDLLTLTEPAVVLAQPELVAGLPARTHVRDAAEVLLAGGPAICAAPAQESTTYMLIPTSGSTGGRPKAVRVTGAMLGHAAVGYADLLGLGPSDSTAIHLPFGWVSGHVTQLAPTMFTGGTAVSMPSFSAAELISTAATHHVTWLDVVPSMWELLLRADGFNRNGLPQIRAAVFGGSPARPGTLARVRAALPGIALHDVYAQSETCAPVTVLSDRESSQFPGSVGRPLPYAKVRIVGPDGENRPEGDVGLVQVRSPATTPGYWGVDASPVTADGWLQTADLGRLEAGVLTLAGRSTGLIIRGGVNVAPAQVEQALLSSGQLSDAAVIGLPGGVAGEQVAAAVVAAPDVAPDLHALRTAVAETVGLHAVPRPLVVLAGLPRNAHGKVDTTALVPLLAAAAARARGGGDPG